MEKPRTATFHAYWESCVLMIRLATFGDFPALKAPMELAIEGLQRQFLDPQQIPTENVLKKMSPGSSL